MRHEFSPDQRLDAAHQTVNDLNRITSRMQYVCTRRKRCEDLVSTSIGDKHIFCTRSSADVTVSLPRNALIQVTVPVL